MSLTPDHVGDAGGVLRERRPRGKKRMCNCDTSHHTSPDHVLLWPPLPLRLSLSQSLAFISRLISAFHANNHPDTCLSRHSFSRWNVLTFNLLCPAGNLSHACPEFLSFQVSAWCVWCIFLVTPVFFLFFTPMMTGNMWGMLWNGF